MSGLPVKCWPVRRTRIGTCEIAQSPAGQRLGHEHRHDDAGELLREKKESDGLLTNQFVCVDWQQKGDALPSRQLIVGSGTG